MQVIRVLIVLLFFTAIDAKAETIKIGWIGPLTGNSAVLGIDSMQAAQLAIEEANSDPENKNKFRLIVEDDQYETSRTVSAYSKLAAQGVVAIIVSTYGGVFAIANRAQKDDIVIINPLDCNDAIADLPDNIFCVATQSESVGQVIAEDIQKNNSGPVAIIYDEKNPFMTLVANTIMDLMVENTTFLYAVDQSASDFKSNLLRAKSKKVLSIVFLGHDPMGGAMHQARSLGLESQFYTVGTITSPGYQELAGRSAEGALVAYWEAPNNFKLKEFLKKFETKVGRMPILQLATIPTYDVSNIITTSLKNKADPSSAQIRNYFQGLKNYSGVSGIITIDDDGASRSIRETLYRFTGGKLVRKIPS